MAMDRLLAGIHRRSVGDRFADRPLGNGVVAAPLAFSLYLRDRGVGIRDLRCRIQDH